jgi:hypothetical protein
MGIDTDPIQLKGRVRQEDFIIVAGCLEKVRNSLLAEGEAEKAESVHDILQRIERGNPSLTVTAGGNPQPTASPDPDDVSTPQQ